MKKRYLIGGATILVLVGTMIWASRNPQFLIQTFAASPEEKLARSYSEAVRTNNYAFVAGAIDPTYKAALDHAWPKMRSAFPKSAFKKIQIVGSNTFSLSTASGVEKTKYDFTYEYEFSNRWVISEIILIRTNGKLGLNGLYFYPQSVSLERANSFEIQGKSPLHYFFLISAIALPIFTIASAITAYRTPIPKRKWLWVIFVLIGLGTASLNWTTGAWTLQPLSFNLFAAGFTQNFYGPLSLQIGLPLGAIIFWFKRRKWRVQPSEADLL